MANQSPSDQIANLAARMGELVDGVKQINNTINGPTGLIVQVELLKRDVDDSENALQKFAESTRRSVDVVTEMVRGNGKPGLIQELSEIKNKIREHQDFIEGIKALLWKVAGIAVASGGVGSAVISAVLQAMR